MAWARFSLTRTSGGREGKWRWGVHRLQEGDLISTARQVRRRGLLGCLQPWPWRHGGRAGGSSWGRGGGGELGQGWASPWARYSVFNFVFFFFFCFFLFVISLISFIIFYSMKFVPKLLLHHN